MRVLYVRLLRESKMSILSDSSGLLLMRKCFIDPVLQETTLHILSPSLWRLMGFYDKKKKGQSTFIFIALIQSLSALCFTERQWCLSRETWTSQERLSGHCCPAPPPRSSSKCVELPTEKVTRPWLSSPNRFSQGRSVSSRAKKQDRKMHSDFVNSLTRHMILFLDDDLFKFGTYFPIEKLYI